MVSDWKSITLHDVATLRNGAGVKQAFFTEEPDGVPLIKVSNFTDDSISIAGLTKVDSTHAQQWESHFIENGDVLVATVGSWPPNWSSVVGKVVKAPIESSGAIQNQNTCCIQPSKIVDKKFLYYKLKNRDFLLWVSNVAQGSANQARIPVKQLGKYNFKLPPFPEQKAIAHILGSLDDKIELNRQMNETLEAMAQGLFKSWFVDFDPVIDNALAASNAIPDEFMERAEQRKTVEKKDSSDIQALFPDEFEFTEEMGWIPKGWSVDSVDNLIEISPRLTLKKGTLASHADMKALPESGFNIDGVIEKEYSGGTKFQNRDVLFARITPCLENGKTGIVDFLEPGEVGFGSTEFIVLREKDNITMEFVACLARNNKFRLHAIQSMVGSSGRQRVQNSCFSDFYMALPKSSNKVLELFHEMTSVNFEKISIQAKESRTLAKLRDTLLPKLMSGELRIPDAKKLVADI